jgi:hypothetical protein
MSGREISRYNLGIKIFLTPVLALAAAAALAAATTRDDSINAAFNAWAIKGLQAARAEWRADACLAAAAVDSRPGAGEKEEHYAGGEIYEFYYYSAENPTADYRFRSPLLPYEAGKITHVEQSEEKGAGPIVGPRRCITEMPVTLERAIRIARRAGLTMDARTIMEAQRNRFEDADFADFRVNPLHAWPLTQHAMSFAARGREIWLVAELEPFPGRGVSCVSVDARSGRVIKKVFNATPPELK